MTQNPFDTIDLRLSNIENILLDLKHTPKIDEPKPEYITRKETAKILGISLVTLTDYVKNGLVPSYKIGSRVRFKRDEVFASMTHRKYSHK